MAAPGPPACPAPAAGHLHQLLQGAARLLQAPQQLQDARVAHTVVAQVQLSQAAVGQQERGEAAAAAVGHLTVPKTEWRGGRGQGWGTRASAAADGKGEATRVLCLEPETHLHTQQVPRVTAVPSHCPAVTGAHALMAHSPEHPQCGARLAQGLAQLLDARVTQLVAAQLKFQEMLVLGQHQADVLAAGRREAAGLHPVGSRQGLGVIAAHGAARPPYPPALPSEGTCTPVSPQR